MYTVYEDATLLLPVTPEGNLTNPDEEDDLDADAGETGVIKALWCAAVQTTLAAAISDAVTTTITLAAAVFKWTDCPVIKIDSELLYVTAGLSPAGVTLTVVRGWNGTTAAAHSNGAVVYMAYNATNLIIDCRDNETAVTGDNSASVMYCLDSGGSPDGNWQATLTLGASLAYNSSIAFHRRKTVTAGSDSLSETDLIHDLDFRLIPLAA
jgi:hypothetical protein